MGHRETFRALDHRVYVTQRLVESIAITRPGHVIDNLKYSQLMLQNKESKQAQKNRRDGSHPNPNHTGVSCLCCILVFAPSKIYPAVDFSDEPWGHRPVCHRARALSPNGARVKGECVWWGCSWKRDRHNTSRNEYKPVMKHISRVLRRFTKSHLIRR